MEIQLELSDIVFAFGKEVHVSLAVLQLLGITHNVVIALRQQKPHMLPFLSSHNYSPACFGSAALLALLQQGLHSKVAGGHVVGFRRPINGRSSPLHSASCASPHANESHSCLYDCFADLKCSCSTAQ